VYQMQILTHTNITFVYVYKLRTKCSKEMQRDRDTFLSRLTKDMP